MPPKTKRGAMLVMRPFRRSVQISTFSVESLTLMKAGDTGMDNICMSFANIIDAKSPFTLNHSVGVANATVAIRRVLGLPRNRELFLRHAALLHDLGKLGVSNAILEKPAKLDDGEWQAMKQHPFHTWKILRAIPGFDEMSEVAGSHHEKLDAKASRASLLSQISSMRSRQAALPRQSPPGACFRNTGQGCASITAMPRPRHNSTTRTVSAALAGSLHNPLISGRRNALHGQALEA
jgi:hypothetical protein